ncbi:MAG TPA: hypothetical protein VMR70_09435 [Flavisolibacter sp.]|nr:hypothetical protein [Flavisolibacter sp.]
MKKPTDKRESKPVNSRPQPERIQSLITPTDSIIQIRTDSLKIAAPLADVKPAKQKPKTFQKDFEGIATRVDTSRQKTASKAFQFSWRSQDEKATNAEEPRLRITQKF